MAEMLDLHRLTISPWCRKCGLRLDSRIWRHFDGAIADCASCFATLQPSLFVRLPESRPEGLDHVNAELRASPEAAEGWYLECNSIKTSHAVTLCVGHWLAILREAYISVRFGYRIKEGDGHRIEMNPGNSLIEVEAETLTEALVIALHRLADFSEAAEPERTSP